MSSFDRPDRRTSGLRRPTRGELRTTPTPSRLRAIPAPIAAYPAPSAPPGVSIPRRLEAFDAARGMAMLLVCLSHFTAVYFRREYETLGNLIPVKVAMLASPTFLAISGMMMGLLSVVYRRSFPALRVKLVDRALFVLTVGHVLIALARVAFERDTMTALRMTFVTDTVGVCVLVGALLITSTSSATRVMLGVGSFALSWALIVAWHPASTASAVAKEILVGGAPNTVMAYTVPWLQWLGVYLTCTALGEHVGSLYRRHRQRLIERTMATVAALSVLTAVLLRVGSWAFRSVHFVGSRARVLELFFSPWSKLSPSPVYVLFFGGLGLGLVAAVVVAVHHEQLPWLMGPVSRIGRSSLAVFTVQNYVYYAILGSLSLPRTPYWPLLFALTLAPIFLFSRFWDGRQLNRVLTVGVQRLILRRPATE